KSHLYKEISPNSILVSGGQTTVANLFYNMASRQVGLVGLWDCVAFDEVAGITFKDKDGVQIMKDYMASGSFARGKEEKAASASMVFVGNINQSVEVMLKTSHLFEPFPDAMAYDTAFLDRMHCYVPGWEIQKYRPEFFTNDYGFISDFLSEFMHQMRKETFSDASDKFFRFGTNLNQRDTIAVRKMISGFTKLIYPDGNYSKEDMEEIVKYSLEMRRRVKEQLKKIGGMEFYDVNFSYIDNESFEEHYVGVPEQGGGKLIPEGMSNPGQIYTVSRCKTGMVGVYRLETQILPGNGKFERTGIGSDREVKEATNTAFNYLKANSNTISASISTTTKDYIINYQDLNGIGLTKYMTLPTMIAICSASLSKPALSSLAVLGEISISGTILKVEELANVLQVCLDSGAKKVLLPITSAAQLGSVPSDLVGAFSLIFYSTPQEAVFKALGVD
ncbi:MAG: protease Lon-related BREX system protein BrxL, partial [Christensenellaceae bacterium]